MFSCVFNKINKKLTICILLFFHKTNYKRKNNSNYNIWNVNNLISKYLFYLIYKIIFQNKIIKNTFLLTKFCFLTFNLLLTTFNLHLK